MVQKTPNELFGQPNDNIFILVFIPSSWLELLEPSQFPKQQRC